MSTFTFKVATTIALSPVIIMCVMMVREWFKSDD